MKWPGQESPEGTPGTARAPWPGTIRPLAAGDLAAVAALEAACNTQPWSLDALQQTLKASASSVIGRVAIHDGNVIGYLVATVAADEGEIFILGVDPAARRQGVAAALLEDALGVLRAAGAKAVFLEVRRGNKAAIGLYNRFGFGEAGVRKGYYTDTGEDALLLHVFLRGQRR